MSVRMLSSFFATTSLPNAITFWQGYDAVLGLTTYIYEMGKLRATTRAYCMQTAPYHQGTSQVHKYWRVPFKIDSDFL
jgi:hypothetical protein